MSFSLKIEMISRIFASLVLAFILSGCLAKDASKLDYYELGYDDSNKNLICDRRADTFIKLSYIKVQNGYDSRDIIIKDGINISKMENVKYISSPKDMLKKAFELYLYNNCHLKLSSQAKLQLGLNIIEMSIRDDYAFIQIALELKDGDKMVLSDIVTIQQNYEANPISALNLALNKALERIHSLVLGL
ncbi:hypothetical protein V2I28_07640 [Campylobacter sp. CX2-4080-23]|uniref:hypothetical protein n=1 Tax=Campylobacter porcelli TaxID=1660073 RepID=UPI002EC493D4|nr:hypothetical protein [Campylobacter sp. CX2-4080-23]